MEHVIEEKADYHHPTHYPFYDRTRGDWIYGAVIAALLVLAWLEIAVTQAAGNLCA